MNSYGGNLPFHTSVTKSDQPTFGRCGHSLPKETESPVVHIHSMVCPYPPLLPILFPMGSRRLLGYIDSKPRRSRYTPSMVSALFLLLHTSDTWRIKWGPWGPVPWTHNGFKRQEKNMELIRSWIPSDFLRIAFLITAEVNIFILALSHQTLTET